MRAAKEMLGAVQDGGEAEMQRPEARVLEWQLGVVQLDQEDFGWRRAWRDARRSWTRLQYLATDAHTKTRKSMSGRQREHARSAAVDVEPGRSSTKGKRLMLL
jgi:hypothetical protein